MKKIISSVLCFVLCAAMLCACGNSGSGKTTTEEVPDIDKDTASVTYEDYAYDRSWPTETVKIGVELFNTTDETWIQVKKYFDYISEYFNVEFIYSENISSGEQELAFVDNCASQGCMGIYGYYNVSGTSVMMEVCNNLGLFYAGAAVSEYYDKMKDNPLIVGSYYEGDSESGESADYQTGYTLGYTTAMLPNITHIVYASGETTVGMFKQRQQGFLDGLNQAWAEGSTVRFDESTDIIGGWPDASGFASMQTAALNSDYDAVVSANNISYWFQPIKNSGKDIKMACIGTVSDTFKPYMDDGSLVVMTYEPAEFVHGSAIAMMINCCTGYRELAENADGTPRLQHVYRWTIGDAATFDQIYDMHSNGEFFVTKEDLAKVFGGLNPNATIDTMDEVYDRTMEESLS